LATKGGKRKLNKKKVAKSKGGHFEQKTIKGLWKNYVLTKGGKKGDANQW